MRKVMTRSAAALAVAAAVIVPLSGVASAAAEPRTGHHHHKCSCSSADAWLAGGKGFYTNVGGPAGITNAGGAFIAGGESMTG